MMTQDRKVSKHRALRLAAMGFLALPLVACQTVTDWATDLDESDTFDQVLSSHQAEQRYSEQESIATTMAVVKLRDRREGILAATERRYRNGFSQRIVYPTVGNIQGENWIDLRVVGRKNSEKTLSEKLTLHSNRAAIIQQQAKAAMLNGKITADQGNFYQNAYGPYGLIFAKQPGNVGCVYGWQTLLQDTNAVSDHNGLGDARSWPAQQGLSYRLRYCAKGLSQSGAKDLMQRVQLAPRFARLWDKTTSTQQVKPLAPQPVLVPQVTKPKAPAPANVATRAPSRTKTVPLSSLRVPHPLATQPEEPSAPLLFPTQKPKRSLNPSVPGESGLGTQKRLVVPTP